jgi:hypothetical protein
MDPFSNVFWRFTSIKIFFEIQLLLHRSVHLRNELLCLFLFLIRNNGFVNIHSIHSLSLLGNAGCIFIILLGWNNICGNFNKKRTIKSGPIDFNFFSTLPFKVLLSKKSVRILLFCSFNYLSLVVCKTATTVPLQQNTL